MNTKKESLQPRDSEGFIELVKKPDFKLKEKSKKAVVPKKLGLNPFKKGSWKSVLFKKARKHRVPKQVLDYHFTRAENVALVDKKGKTKAYIHGSKFTEDILSKLTDRRKDLAILVNIGDKMYQKISMKCYEKMMKIDKIAMSIDLQVTSDDGEEVFSMYQDDKIFDNINSFFEYVNYYRQMINGVADSLAVMWGFMFIEYKIKSLVILRDGTTKTFKGDMNDLLEWLNFEPLL